MVASALIGWVWGCAAPDMFDPSPDPEARSSPECTRAIDHHRFGRDVAGAREYEGQLVAVIAVDGSAYAPSGRHQRQKESSATLPVAAVGAVLRQSDGISAVDRFVSIV